MMSFSSKTGEGINIAVYISGHGFGHASRTCEIINALSARRPGLFFHIRTSVPQWFFNQSLKPGVRFHYAQKVVDIGVVQKDALHLEKKETLEVFSDFWLSRKLIVESERDYFKSRHPSLILADIPPVAFEIAAELSITSIGVTNFSWDWIYRDYAALFPEFNHLLDEIREAYKKATLLLRLPFHGDLSAFEKIRDIPLVARKWSRNPEEVRRKFSLPCEIPLVLLSFGGFGVDYRLMENAATIKGYHFVTTFPSQGEGSHFTHIREEQLIHSGLTYPDIVNASAVVIGKPGYGLVSECIANCKPLIYTSRGDFAEYDVLVRGIKRFLRSEFIPHEELFRGSWQGYIQRVLSSSTPEPMETNGAETAAREIEAYLFGRGLVE
jgi:hypothetical protein